MRREACRRQDASRDGGDRRSGGRRDGRGLQRRRRGGDRGWQEGRGRGHRDLELRSAAPRRLWHDQEGGSQGGGEDGRSPLHHRLCRRHARRESSRRDHRGFARGPPRSGPSARHRDEAGLSRCRCPGGGAGRRRWRSDHSPCGCGQHRGGPICKSRLGRVAWGWACGHRSLASRDAPRPKDRSLEAGPLQRGARRRCRGWGSGGGGRPRLGRSGGCFPWPRSGHRRTRLDGALSGGGQARLRQLSSSHAPAP